MQISDVEEAKKCRRKMSKLYEVFLGREKINAWLVNRGVRCQTQRDDLISKLDEVFVELLISYDGRQEFEKYVWGRFRYEVLRFFHVKKSCKKYSEHSSIDAGGMSDLCYSINFDAGIDLENATLILDDSERHVLDQIALGVKRKEILEGLDKPYEYKRTKNKLREFLQVYA